MKQRTTAPASNNKFYLKKPYGYNPCILGNAKHRQYAHSVLVNCTGYVTGRLGETSGDKKCEYLGNTNAENYYELAQKQGLEVGDEPREGAVICWQGVGSKAGHVAFIEKVVSDTEIYTSESGWSYSNHYILNKTRKKGNGNWGLSTASYKDPMFIYNPNIDPYPPTTKVVLKLGSKGEDVKWLQWAICRAGYKIAIDGSFGNKTEKALKKAQKNAWGLVADGMCGKKTQAKIKSLYSIEG